MIKHFNYPVKLNKQKEGGYLVTFPDLPEAITQGEDIENALIEAADCLEEAIANRIETDLDIPKPSHPKRNQHVVSLSTTMVAKAALYLIVREKNLSNVVLAKKLDCDEKEIRRLLDPYYSSKLPRIEHMLHLLGHRLNVGVTNLS